LYKFVHLYIIWFIWNVLIEEFRACKAYIKATYALISLPSFKRYSAKLRLQSSDTQNTKTISRELGISQPSVNNIVKVRDIEDLPQRIMQMWDELDKGIIDASVKHWRRRLRACVAANGRQFEHKL